MFVGVFKNKYIIGIVACITIAVAAVLFGICNVWDNSHTVGHYFVSVTNNSSDKLEVLCLKAGDEELNLKVLQLAGNWYVSDDNTLITEECGANFSLEFDGEGTFSLFFSCGSDCANISVIQSTGIVDNINLGEVDAVNSDTYEYVISNNVVLVKKLLVFDVLVCVLTAFIMATCAVMLIARRRMKSYISLGMLLLETLMWMLGIRLSIGVVDIKSAYFNYVFVIIISLAGLWGFGCIADCLSDKWSDIRISKTSVSIQLAIHMLIPVIAFLYVEFALQYHGYQQSVITWLANLAFYCLIDWILFGFTLDNRISAIITFIVSGMFAYTDYFVWLIRNRNFMAGDLSVAATALKVSGNYEFSMDAHRMFCLIALMAIILIFLFAPNVKIFGWKKRSVGIVLACTLFGVASFGISKIDLAKSCDINISWWNETIRDQYDINGFALAFVAYGQNMGLEEPEGYSKEAVEAILQEVQEEINSGAIVEINGDVTAGTNGNINSDISDDKYSNNDSPNIIVIMNEAWSDIFNESNSGITKDCMPFYHSLTDNVIKGDMYVSITGGNTVDTEYEFLTGNSMAFFPSGSVPYMQYIENNTESAERYYEALGYKTVTFHPYYDYCYDRNSVYQKMGFSTSYWNADVMKEDRGYYGSWFSDEADFCFVESLLDDYAADATFIFNVTIQNHGPYDNDLVNGLIDADFGFDSQISGENDAIEYATKLYETDKALEELIEYYQDCDKDTVIVMFGDHQPKLSEWVYDYTLPQDGSLEALQTRYVVPFLIWTNFDIEEQSDVAMSANYLNAYLVNLLGMKPSAYYQYLYDQYQSIPAMNAFGYLGADGNWYDYGCGSAEYESLIDTYRQIQYYNLTENNNAAVFFR